MNEKDQKSQAEQIALFRYGIIAPVLHDSSMGQTRYFSEISLRLKRHGSKGL